MIPSLGGPPPIPAVCPRWRRVTRPIAAHVFDALHSPLQARPRRRSLVLDIRSSAASVRLDSQAVGHTHAQKAPVLRVFAYAFNLRLIQRIWACSGLPDFG